MMVESLLGTTPDSCTTCTSREFPHITANAPIISLGEGKIWFIYGGNGRAIYLIGFDPGYCAKVTRHAVDPKMRREVGMWGKINVPPFNYLL